MSGRLYLNIRSFLHDSVPGIVCVKTKIRTVKCAFANTCRRSNVSCPTHIQHLPLWSKLLFPYVPEYVCTIACTYRLPPLRLRGRYFQQSDNVRGETNLRVCDIAHSIILRVCWKQCNLFLLKHMKYSLRYACFHLFKFKTWVLIFFNINEIVLL